MAEKCKECGCMCVQCSRDDQSRSDMHLHVEIENLRQRLLERDNHIVTMETQFLNEAEKFPNGELASIKEEILTWQEKYSRLYEAHKRVQKVNQNLEDKLLRIVDKCETEKGAFAKDVATLSHRLADANYTIRRLTQDNEKYRNDVNLAIQLLQCKPSNFVGQKYDSLPSEVQTKVKMYIAQKRRSSEVTLPDIKSITVPISTFPPTAMVYNVTKANVEKDSDNENDESKPPVDVVSAAIMAKVLEDREKERIFAKHCDTCTCHRSILTTDTEVQTTDFSKLYNICKNCGTKDNVQSATVVPENVGKTVQSKDNLRSVTRHYYERNDNSCKRSTFRASHENTVDDGKSKFQGSINSAKHLDFQRTNVQNSESLRVDLKDYPNAKSYYRTDVSQNRTTKQGTDRNMDDKSTDKMDRARQVRSTTAKPDARLDTESKTSDRWKLERNSCRRYFVDAPRDDSTQREQSRMDVINERLWKNEWTKRKDRLNSNDVTSEWQKRASGEVQIDVINDRIWKNEKSRPREGKLARLTLIEVTGADHLTNQSDCGQPENAASPSFSSDSIVISTSDPPSSCSDSVRPIKEKQSIYNNNLRAVSQDRTAGPRNCLMRVTPGSKNILLDNTGHYQTVLYTSGGNNNRPSTALVHTTKSLRSGRSTSTSSEENSPILPHDDVQLQRVAEWVRASGPADNASNPSSKVQGASLICASESKASQERCAHFETRCNNTRLVGVPSDTARSTTDDTQTSRVPRDVRDGDCCTKSAVDDLGPKGNEDLITFDLSNDETSTDQVQNLTKADSVSELNYEVKITKEMEETYLKLAASLDPVTLRLSSSTSADLTIEKYRRDHKRLNVQKTRDKSGSAT